MTKKWEGVKAIELNYVRKEIVLELASEKHKPTKEEKLSMEHIFIEAEPKEIYEIVLAPNYTHLFFNQEIGCMLEEPTKNSVYRRLKCGEKMEEEE